MEDFQFYVGSHNPSWLWGRENTTPLFISIRRFRKYKKYKKSLARWACDSGGFTELSLYDKWVTTPEQYIEELYRLREEVGMMDWASPQDWMCEPHMIVKTGKSVDEHQKLSCENFLRLQEIGPDLPIIPVLQGWDPSDYLKHLDMYSDYGVDLRKYDTVGMGSFCRRANVQGVNELVNELYNYGIRMHGFGLKKDGLTLFGDKLVSSDSMAWSFTGRAAGWKNIYLCGTTHEKAISCGNCHAWAMKWAESVKTSRKKKND